MLAVHPKPFCFNPRALPKLIAEQHHQPYVGWTSKLQIMSLCVSKYSSPRSRGARWGVGVAHGGGGRRDEAQQVHILWKRKEHSYKCTSGLATYCEPTKPHALLSYT